eukprot:8592879-Lingulodinium_polyedra.AAC.1
MCIRDSIRGAKSRSVYLIPPLAALPAFPKGSPAERPHEVWALAEMAKVPDLPRDAVQFLGPAANWARSLYSTVAVVGEFMELPGASEVVHGSLLDTFRCYQWIRTRYALPSLVPVE